ncbi:MAG: GNAT family N-acetyltransferase [Ilumatobacteraceae bacterium]
MTGLDVRLTAPDELRAAADAARTALLFPPTGDDDWGKYGHGWRDDHLSVSAWDGDHAVGHAGSLPVTTKVPGGQWLATAAVTRVGVKPTHTRQGALTRMMHLLLQTERERGAALASLRASEAVIYGRYGYGLAGEATRVVIDPKRLLPLRGAASGTFRQIRGDEVLPTAQAIYERIDHRVGAITRTKFLWERTLADAVEPGKAGYLLVHTSADGVDDGYAHYTVKWQDNGHRENMGELSLGELFGASPAVELALWQYLCTVSLVRTISCDTRPDDDVVRLAAEDIRAYDVQRRWDEQWVRLLDVEACLTARRWGSDDTVTIAVVDPMFADNHATFRIGGRGVERTTESADITAPIDALSAAYLGGRSWADLVAAGRATSDDAAAIAAADRLFAHRPGTFCGTFF